MARGVNKVILVGNVGQDPEVRQSSGGNAITNISVATSESWKDKTTGQKQEKTEWHRVVMFNRLGEIAGEYLRKGSKVYIEGKLQTRKWQGQDGQDRYTTEIVANEMQMLDPQQPQQQAQQYPVPQYPQQQPVPQYPQQQLAPQYPQHQPAPQHPQPVPQQTPVPNQQPAPQQAPAPQQGMESFDDDIPF